MKKILIVFGTRPEAIKLCPLVIELKKHPEEFETIVCVTAQHREMLDQVLDIFSIKPDYDLNLMTHDQSLADLTARCISGMDGIIKKVRPDMLIVQGDTTTTFSASLAAFYNHITVAHVEAGLRTGNKFSPFPEEANRKLTTVIADVHYAPTARNKENLVRENIKDKDICVTGNTVIDALLWVRDKLRNESVICDELKDIDFSRKIVLVTGHRRENFGQGFSNVCAALRDVALKNPDIDIIYPVHLNPNVQKPVKEILGNIKNVILIKPLDYKPFVQLMDKSYFIISDSGGVQEEAPSLGKPVLVTRDTTERPEAVDTGVVKLVGTDINKIVSEANLLIKDLKYYEAMSKVQNPYGDGQACNRIVTNLINFFNC